MPSSSTALTGALAKDALPLRTAQDLDPLIEAIGDARFVLLGEASHGTHEFYTWRAELSRRLIAEKQFSFIAVEGDWPDCYRISRYVKGYSGSEASAVEVLRAFSRWPTWMWANREVAELVEWMRGYNRTLPTEQQAGFYGLDVYSLWDSMHAVVGYLDTIDPDYARTARRAYRCFEPYSEDAQKYARATAMVPMSCEDEALGVLQALRARSREYQEDGRESYFNAEQNALVARGAELYYRTMMRGGPTSWNVRDHHMMDTLDRLMAHHGPHARAIVWEHNTHIGDARFTDMARAGMVNIGELARQAHGAGPGDRDGVMLVGFGTHHGTVMAGEEWGEPMQRMKVPPAQAGSFEDIAHHATRGENALYIFDGSDDGGVVGLDAPIGHRAIGVVYDPRMERFGNYVPTIVPRRYDAFCFIDESRAVDAVCLPVDFPMDAPETYPSGM